MQRHFDEEIDSFNKQLLKMAALTEEAIYKSIEALKNRDKKAAQAVIDEDRRIDELEISIEEMGIDLLARRQPLAKDLRIITTGMRMNSELERIADLAVNISQRAIELANEPLLKPLVDTKKLAKLARKMVKESIDAFVNTDETLARKVILADPEADDLRNRIYEELINDYMVKDGKCSPRAVPLILVSRHLERICDHATYIAEDVIYMVQALVVKHHPEKLQEEGNK